MNKVVSRALWGAFFVGGLTVLGAGAAHAADTSGEDGTASGNQVGILGELPVTVGGNAISILGDSESSGSTTAPTGGDSTASTSATSGEGAIAGGNQVVPDVVAPIVASGNAISVLGDSSTEGTHTSAPTDAGTEGTTANTTGEDAAAGGNQVAPDLDAPITISGNDVSVIRDDSLLEDGLLGGGVDTGLLEDGLLEDGLLEAGMIEGPIISLGIVDDMMPTSPMPGEVLPGDTVVSDVVSEPLITAPLVNGPLVSDVDADVLAPVVNEAVVGDDTTGTDGTDSTGTPLLATAALSGTMMLAATGVEALPLIGGIALMLGTGLGLVALKRMNYAIN